MEERIEERIDISGSVVSSTIGPTGKESVTATVDYDGLTKGGSVITSVKSTIPDISSDSVSVISDSIGLPGSTTYISYPTPSLVSDSVSTLSSEVEELRRTIREEMEKKDTWTDYITQAISFQSCFQNFIKELLGEEPEYTEKYLRALPKKIIKEFCKDFIEALYEDYKSSGFLKEINVGGKKCEIYNPKYVAKTLEKLGVLKPEDTLYL